MGQKRWPDPGGTQGDQGQTKGQNRKCGRRGVEGNKFGAMVTTEGVGKPPPSCGGGGGSAETEQQLALQSSFEGCGAHRKNPKNIQKMGTWR